jgi:hypothetical protein
MSRVNWAILATFVALIATAFALPGPDDAEAEADSHKSMATAIELETRELRFDQAARAICGVNAGYEHSGSTLTCYTHKGQKTSQHTLTAK